MGIFSAVAIQTAKVEPVKYKCPLCAGVVHAKINRYDGDIQAACENCGAMYIGGLEYKPKEVQNDVYITERDDLG